MALGSLVWDASATMIDVPLENAINMVNNIFSTLMFSFSAIFWMCSTAAFCIRMWIFILNSTNIRKYYFFLTALVDCKHYKYIIIPNALVFLNNEHAPQWMLCCQGSDGESLKGLCLHLGEIPDFCIHHWFLCTYWTSCWIVSQNTWDHVSWVMCEQKAGRKDQWMTMCLTAQW